jgi:hypothetical protein
VGTSSTYGVPLYLTSPQNVDSMFQIWNDCSSWISPTAETVESNVDQRRGTPNSGPMSGGVQVEEKVPEEGDHNGGVGLGGLIVELLQRS